MKVELNPDAAQWVEAVLAAGRFATAEDVVRYAINRTKRAELRELLDASEAEGGSHTSAEARTLRLGKWIEQRPRDAKWFEARPKENQR